MTANAQSIVADQLTLAGPALGLAELDREIARAERAYDRACRHPRGEGLAEAGAELHRLYDRRRKLTTDAPSRARAREGEVA